MPSHTASYHSSHTPEQLFDLVADIEHYPEFLPWVHGAEVKEQLGHAVVAELRVHFMAIHTKYTSYVELHPPSDTDPTGTIETKLVEGPFRHLSNNWTFEPDGNGGTNIHFHVGFSFKSSLFELAIGKVFDKAVSDMYQAFSKRADTLYSTPSAT